MNSPRNVMNPYHSYNGGGPNVAPMGRSFGNYAATSAPRQVAAGGAGGDTGGPAYLDGGSINAVLGGHGQQHAPHVPQPKEEEGGPAEKGPAEAAEESGAAAGAGEAGAGEALTEIGMIGGLL